MVSTSVGGSDVVGNEAALVKAQVVEVLLQPGKEFLVLSSTIVLLGLEALVGSDFLPCSGNFSGGCLETREHSWSGMVQGQQVD